MSNLRRNPSTGSIRSTVSAFSSKPRPGTYDSNPINIQEVHDAQKFIFMIKALEQQKEAEEKQKQMERFGIKFQDTKLLREELTLKRQQNDDHAHALKLLYITKELIETGNTLSELLAKLTSAVGSARINLSDKNFAVVKDLITRFKTLYSSYPHFSELQEGIKSIPTSDPPPETLKLSAPSFVDEAKVVAGKCDKARTVLKEFQEKIAYLDSVNKIANSTSGV